MAEDEQDAQELPTDAESSVDRREQGSPPGSSQTPDPARWVPYGLDLSKFNALAASASSPAIRAAMDAAARFTSINFPPLEKLAAALPRTPLIDEKTMQLIRQFAVQQSGWQRQIEQMRASLSWVYDTPAMRRAVAQIRELTAVYLPANWRGHDVDSAAVWELAAEGLPLVWVPRGEIVVELIAASDAEGRWVILAERAPDIVDDCATVTASVTLTPLLEYRERLEEAIAAHRDGHVAAAQALAAVVFTSLLQYAYGHGKLANVLKSPLRSRDPEEEELTRFRAALLIEASIPAIASVGDLVPEERWPERFNRNLTLHRVSKRQYTEAHSVTAVMLASALLAESQQLVNRGVLRLEEGDPA